MKKLLFLLLYLVLFILLCSGCSNRVHKRSHPGSTHDSDWSAKARKYMCNDGDYNGKHINEITKWVNKRYVKPNPDGSGGKIYTYYYYYYYFVVNHYENEDEITFNVYTDKNSIIQKCVATTESIW